MTIEEKRQAMRDYCSSKRLCTVDQEYHCPLYGLKGDLDCSWVLDEDSTPSESAVNASFELVSAMPDYQGRKEDPTPTNPPNSPNPYWDNITAISNAQRKVGISEYGQGLEANQKPAIERIKYIEEELIDALMYLEWLKESLSKIKEDI